jgi:hypothetical protein
VKAIVMPLARERGDIADTALLSVRARLRYPAGGPDRRMGEQRLLSPEELAALFKQLDALIEEARALQERISERLLTHRREDQPDWSGQPRFAKKTRRPRAPRKK